MISLLTLMGRRPLPSGGVDVSDVFSTDLYTGNATSQSIDNGIDLDGEGGLVWFKGRNVAVLHALWDTERGVEQYLSPVYTSPSQSVSGQGVTAFGASGFTVSGTNGGLGNGSGTNYAAWTFRNSPGFFKVTEITHTNGATTDADLSTLNVVGMVAAKITTTTGDWIVWHRSLTSSNNLRLNTTAAESSTDAWLSVSGTTATLSGSAPTGTYSIYAWAHDEEGIVQCGEFTTDGSGEGEIATGWDNGSQYLQLKAAGTTGNWEIYDTARTPGFTGSDDLLVANTTAAETTVARLAESGGTITASSLSASQDYIYMVIRAEEI